MFNRYTNIEEAKAQLAKVVASHSEQLINDLAEMKKAISVDSIKDLDFLNEVPLNISDTYQNHKATRKAGK